MCEGEGGGDVWGDGGGDWDWDCSFVRFGRAIPGSQAMQPTRLMSLTYEQMGWDGMGWGGGGGGMGDVCGGGGGVGG